MKKVNLLSLTLLLVTQISFAQVFTSSFESWSDPNSPDGWVGNTVAGNTTTVPAANITQVADAQDGNSSCRLVNTTSTHTRFTTEAVNITAGDVYEISFWAKGSGEVRTGIVTLSTGGTSAYGAYGQYIVLTNTWTQYTQNVTGNNTNIGEFIFSIRNSAAPNHIMIDNVNITTGSGSTDYMSIYDIQYTTAANGDSPALGQTVETSGIVTGTYPSGYFIQDGSGPWRGIHVFDNNNIPAIGDSVSILGNVVEYFGLTQMAGIAVFQNHSSGNTLPTPVDITTMDLNNQEMYEGVLVRVVEVECTEQNSGFGMWEINDGTGPAKVHGLMHSFTPTLGGEYTITGIVNYSFDEFRICPRDAADVVILNSNVDEVTIYEIQFTTAMDGASPLAGQTVSTSGIVTATWPDEGFFIQDVTGPWNGIFVFNTAINPAMGDLIALTGNVVEFFGLTQLSSISSHQIVSSNNTLPAPAVISSQAANSEQYESVLVRVENAICTNPDAGFGMFRLNNSTADVLVDDDLYDYNAVLGNGYNAQGVMWFSFSEFKMLPRMASDIELVGFASTEALNLESVVLYPNPAETTISFSNYEGAITILDAQGRTVQTATVNASNAPLNIETLDAGVYFVIANNQTIRFVKK